MIKGLVYEQTRTVKQVIHVHNVEKVVGEVFRSAEQLPNVLAKDTSSGGDAAFQFAC